MYNIQITIRLVHFVCVSKHYNMQNVRFDRVLATIATAVFSSPSKNVESTVDMISVISHDDLQPQIK